MRRNVEMHSRKSALTRAKQYRTCPPLRQAQGPNIADDQAYRENLNRHLEICPYCSAQPTENTKIWERLSNAIQESPSPFIPSPESDIILPGQLRHMRSESAKWREGYFYNPPMVLVLETDGETGKNVRVAQIYHDVCLAAPGDLILPEIHREEIFAECWNTYIVSAADLEGSHRQVMPEVTDAAIGLEKNPEACPSWALHPKPLTDNDPRIYFRELEIEVGKVFQSFHNIRGLEVHMW